VPAFVIVEGPRIIEADVDEFNLCLSPPAVRQLDLHAVPEGLDDRFAIAIADRTHRGNQPDWREAEP